MPTQATIALLVCEQCDAAHRKSHLRRGQVAQCARCGARLERAQRLTPDGMLAMTIAAAIMFILAIIYPIVRVDVRGAHGVSSFWGAILARWIEGSERLPCSRTDRFLCAVGRTARRRLRVVAAGPRPALAALCRRHARVAFGRRVEHARGSCSAPLSRWSSSAIWRRSFRISAWGIRRVDLADHAGDFVRPPLVVGTEAEA
jgi:hypothetical protein